MRRPLFQSFRRYCQVMGPTPCLHQTAARRPRCSHQGRKRRLALRIHITIIAINGRAITSMNALNHAMPAGNLEIPIGFDSDPPNIATTLFPFGDPCTKHIPRLKAVDLARPFGTAPWEPQLVNITHTPTLSPFGSDEQRDHLLPVYLLRRRWTHTHRIQPMGLGNAALLSIPFGPAPRACFDGQSRRFQARRWT